MSPGNNRAMFKPKIVQLLGLLGVLVLCLHTSACSDGGSEQWVRHHKLGLDAAKRHEYQIAIAELKAATDKAELFQSSDVRLVTTLNDLCDVYCDAGESGNCRIPYLRAIDVEEAFADESREWRIEKYRSNLGLANYYRDLGRFGLSQPLYTKASRAIESLEGCDDLEKRFRTDVAKMKQISSEEFTAIDSDLVLREPTEELRADLNKQMEEAWRLGRNESVRKGEVAWNKALAYAKRVFGFREGCYRNVVAGMCAFYQEKNLPQKARQVVAEDMKNFLYAESAGIDNNANVTTELVDDALALSLDFALLSKISDQEGNLRQAIEESERGMSILERCGRKDQLQVERMLFLALLYSKSNHLEKEIALLKKTLKIARSCKKGGSSKRVILIRLAAIERAIKNDNQAAAEHLREVIASATDEPTMDPDSYIQTIVELTELEQSLGNHQASKVLFEKAYACIRQFKPKDPGYICCVLNGYADSRKPDQWNDSESCLRESMKLADAMSDKKQRNIWRFRATEKLAVLTARRRGQFEPIYNQALALAMDTKDDCAISTATTAYADAYMKSGNAKKAFAMQQNTIDYWSKHQPASKHAEACVYWSRGVTQMSLGDYAGTAKSAEKAIELEAMEKSPQHALILANWIRLARSRSFNKQPELAEQAFLKAESYAKAKSIRDPQLLSNLQNYWAIVSWLWQKNDAYKTHLDLAESAQREAKSTAAERLEDGITSLNRTFTPGASWISPADLSHAKTGLENMRKKLGRGDLQYVCAAKELSRLFDDAALPQDGESLRTLADSERSGAFASSISKK